MGQDHIKKSEKVEEKNLKGSGTATELLNGSTPPSEPLDKASGLAQQGDAVQQVQGPQKQQSGVSSTQLTSVLPGAQVHATDGEVRRPAHTQVIIPHPQQQLQGSQAQSLQVHLQQAQWHQVHHHHMQQNQMQQHGAHQHQVQQQHMQQTQTQQLQQQSAHSQQVVSAISTHPLHAYSHGDPHAALFYAGPGNGFAPQYYYEFPAGVGRVPHEQWEEYLRMTGGNVSAVSVGLETSDAATAAAVAAAHHQATFGFHPASAAGGVGVPQVSQNTAAATFMQYGVPAAASPPLPPNGQIYPPHSFQFQPPVFPPLVHPPHADVSRMNVSNQQTASAISTQGDSAPQLQSAVSSQTSPESVGYAGSQRAMSVAVGPVVHRAKTSNGSPLPNGVMPLGAPTVPGTVPVQGLHGLAAQGAMSETGRGSQQGGRGRVEVRGGGRGWGVPNSGKGRGFTSTPVSQMHIQHLSVSQQQHQPHQQQQHLQYQHQSQLQQQFYQVHHQPGVPSMQMMTTQYLHQPHMQLHPNQPLYDGHYSPVQPMVSGVPDSSRMQTRGPHTENGCFGDGNSGSSVTRSSQGHIGKGNSNGVASVGKPMNGAPSGNFGVVPMGPFVQYGGEIHAMGGPASTMAPTISSGELLGHFSPVAMTFSGFWPDPCNYNLPDFRTTYDTARFFVIKSYSEDDVHKSIKYNVWSSTQHGNKRLDLAFKESVAKTLAMAAGGPSSISNVSPATAAAAPNATTTPGNPRTKCPVFLFYSVNASGQFCGVAEMVSPVDFNQSVDYWQQDKWQGQFKVKWHIIKDVNNAHIRHIHIPANEYKSVTNSRDTQEVPFEQGLEMLRIFKTFSARTSILDDFSFYDSRQNAVQDYKARRMIDHPQAIIPQQMGFGGRTYQLYHHQQQHGAGRIQPQNQPLPVIQQVTHAAQLPRQEQASSLGAAAIQPPTAPLLPKTSASLIENRTPELSPVPTPPPVEVSTETTRVESAGVSGSSAADHVSKDQTGGVEVSKIQPKIQSPKSDTAPLGKLGEGGVLGDDSVAVQGMSRNSKEETIADSLSDLHLSTGDHQHGEV